MRDLTPQSRRGAAERGNLNTNRPRAPSAHIGLASCRRSQARRIRGTGIGLACTIMDNVEDVRGEGGGGGMGGGFSMPGGGGGLGIGTIIVLGLLAWALGIDPRILIGGAEIFSGPGQTQVQRQGPAPKAGA